MKTKIVGFYGIKGGIGKTTNNTFLAHALQTKENAKVLLYDVDEDKPNAAKWRGRDSENGLITNDSYEIQQAMSEDLLEIIEQVKDRGIYDYIIIDLPAGINQKGVFNVLAFFDVMFIPCAATDSELEDAIAFENMARKHDEVRISENLKPTKRLISFSKTKLILKESSDLVDLENREVLKKHFDVDFMENHLKDYPKISTKYSTVTLMENEKWADKVEVYFNECIDIIKKY
ncbi:MAG: ParA family protein [Flavobacteriales bacterium]|nr:ParA family protein [Flavobacteriales bacterium]